MPLIEGVGDEVLQFLSVVFLSVVTILAWWSTNARPERYRTVLVMRSRHPVTLSIRARSNLMLPSSEPSAVQVTTTEGAAESVMEPVDEIPRDSDREIPLQEMDSIIDADMAMLDNNRLHFYRRIYSENESPNVSETPNEASEAASESEPASVAQMREMDSIVSAMEADGNTHCRLITPTDSNATAPGNSDKKDEQQNGSSDVNIEGESSQANADVANDPPGRKISIKLKYLNDTLKEVDGSLDELLKDFKRRHFSVELSSACRVRLIFNGRVLGDEAATLRACGLHHQAVVHCLVHPSTHSDQRTVPEEGVSGTSELITERPAGERTWDLENILMTLVSIALTIVWFFRCEYSNMFTASASVALFGLTVFYSVAIFGLYLSDAFQFDRRAAPTPPVPNN